MALEIYAYKRFAIVAKYSGEDRTVVIPQTYNGVPVTEIKERAFADTNVERVLVPQTLQTIGANAFANCSRLQYVGGEMNRDILSAFPADELDMREDPAEDTPCLSVLPPNLCTVENGAFKQTSLTRVVFQAESMELGDSVFEGCRLLEKVVFCYCREITMGQSVFMDSTIALFYAPNVKFYTMPEYSFANCANLVSVMTQILAVGTRCFYNCKKLSRLYGPKRLRSIGREAFVGCEQLPIYGKPAKQEASPKETTGLDAQSEESCQEAVNNSTVPAPAQSDSSAAQPKEGDKMYSHNDEADLTSQGLGEPLFRMNINYLGKPARTVPTRLKGIWGSFSDTFFFSIQVPTAYAEVELSTIADQNLLSIMPVMQYIVKNSITIVVLGRQEGQVYAVYEILPAQTGTGKALSPEFFRAVIDRIKRTDPFGENLGESAPPFYMHTEEEYDTYFSICKSRIPAWVISAYQKNKETAHNEGARGKDEDRHALRAMELLANIDWNPHIPKVPTAEEVQKLLDEAFYGMEEVKKWVKQTVALMRRGKLPKGGILLHGTPGTGKTAVAKAIARILSMALIQMDLSAMDDDTYAVSGSFRNYYNARPGRLLENMYRIQSATAVLLVNEVDKAWRKTGGHSAADLLLSVLDKTGIYESFLEEVLPTDNLLCIGTCNNIQDVSRALLDRFEVVEMAEYTAEDKKVIFSNYALPAAMAAFHVTAQQMTVAQEAVDLLTDTYLLEPGARDVERYAEALVRHYCDSADHAKDRNYRHIYTAQDIREIFGPGKAIVRTLTMHPGEAFAVFSHDARIRRVLLEVSVAPGNGTFEVLGPMGQMQKEFCKAAYWCVRNTTNPSVCDLSRLDVTVFAMEPVPDDICNHVGLTCYVAICSKIMNRTLALDNISFLGGCDMNGSLYYDGNHLTPLLRYMKAHGISTLYAPMGTNRLIDPKVNSECNITIIEAQDAATLFSLAAAHSSGCC